jgi:hypothetical protein
MDNSSVFLDFPLICGSPRWISVETRKLQVVLWQQQFCSADRWAFRMSKVPKVLAALGYLHSQLSQLPRPIGPCWFIQCFLASHRVFWVTLCRCWDLFSAASHKLKLKLQRSYACCNVAPGETAQQITMTMGSWNPGLCRSMIYTWIVTSAHVATSLERWLRVLSKILSIVSIVYSDLWYLWWPMRVFLVYFIQWEKAPLIRLIPSQLCDALGSAWCGHGPCTRGAHD